MSKIKDALIDNLFGLPNVVARVLNQNKGRHYHSQPLPKHYSNPKWDARGNAQPTVMQLAFIDAVVRAQGKGDGHHAYHI